jgi:serine phosphatase RsbU (regulator of sigma subunit)
VQLTRSRRPPVDVPVRGAPGLAGLFLVALPFLVMAAVVIEDLVAGPSEGFLPVLSLGPALASVSRRAVHTALIGALALVLGVLLSIHDGLALTRRGVVIIFVTVLGVTVAGVVASAARQRRERELAEVRAVAEVAQQVLLRPVPREAPPLEIAVRYISASAAARIGGDLYEVVSTPHGVRFIIGDVQGKGLPAVGTAAVVLGAFREAAYDAPGLADIAARIELSLRHQAAEEEFVTVVMAQVAAGGPVIEILNCGHPSPLLVRNGSGALVEPPERGLPLGLAELAESVRETISVPFAIGDQMLFYTDGVSEARDKTGNFYSVSESVSLLTGVDPGTGLDRLRDDVMRHVGHALEDDAATLLVKRVPGEVRATPASQAIRAGQVSPGEAREPPDDLDGPGARSRSAHR